jgi:hypothetical protein
MLAAIQATLYNAHFRSLTGVEFLPVDFLGGGNRAERQAMADKQRRKDQAELAIMNAKLNLMRPNSVTPDIPEWARR